MKRLWSTPLIVFIMLIVPAVSKVTAAGRPAPSLPVSDFAVKHDLSPPLALVIPRLPAGTYVEKTIPLHRREFPSPVIKKYGGDPAVQDFFTSSLSPYSFLYPLISSPLNSFEGISNDDNISVTGVAPVPPDPNGDVGLNHYVQWVNIVFAVYDKTGNLLYGPAAGNTLWTGFGGVCETNNQGDPVVLYDWQADRWFMSQFGFDVDTSGNPIGPFYQCIAVSQTPDPTGGWYRYAFKISDTLLNDYSKFGIWADAYYMSMNQFNGNSFAGAGAVAFERGKMLQGKAARMVYINLKPVDPSLFGMLPSHLNGHNNPPGGAPNYFVQFDDDAWGYPADQLEVWAFHVDWNVPANSTFSHVADLIAESFDSNMCNYLANCIAQPDTTRRLDAISDRLMYRLQYRNFGAHQTMVVNQTVDADSSDHAGIRWYELRNTGSGWAINQQGTYSPDGENRWMGSVAMDGSGNIALGYSVSSGTIYPSIRYTGRLAADPLNTLPQGEGVLIDGSGSQTTSFSRWGDYSSMSVDPSDDSRFWYTQEYYDATSSRGWKTRIGSFALAAPPTYTITSSAGRGGSISPLGQITVVEGSTQIYRIKPKKGFHISDVAVDDVPVGAAATYTFSDVTSSHTVDAAFAANITVTSPNVGKVWKAGTRHTIRWTYSSGVSPSVKISLLQSGVFYRTIVSTIPVGSDGNGSYSWLIPADLPTGTYKVKVSSTLRPAVFSVSSDFAIN